MGNIKDVFTDIYKNNAWGCTESVSGSGSTLEATRNLRSSLSEVFAQLNIKTLVDAPCGDRNWMRHLPYKFDRYIGVDIVRELVNKHIESKADTEFFQVNDITTDILPMADAVFCRDCLGHLPTALAKDAVNLFKLSGARYLFSTTFPDINENMGTVVGGWYPINLQLQPFNLPAPAYLINEGNVVGKHIGVWKLEE